MTCSLQFAFLARARRCLPSRRRQFNRTLAPCECAIEVAAACPLRLPRHAPYDRRFGAGVASHALHGHCGAIPAATRVKTLAIGHWTRPCSRPIFGGGGLPLNDRRDEEQNRLSARAARYVRVGTNVGAVAARVASQRLFGLDTDDAKNAAALAAALGGLKGPIMKVAQLMATIPEALPAEYAHELAQLQSQAPPMGPAFVRRRMTAELGSEWARRFGSFEPQPAASASLGQVHRARAPEGTPLAAKLQYPDMQSAVEADLTQLKMVFALHARMNPAVETGEVLKEISARLREELDYELEAKRLLTMTWLEGRRLMDYRDAPLAHRNTIARAMFRAWWYPFSHFGVIHGDPHLGNYTIFEVDGGSDNSQPAPQ